MTLSTWVLVLLIGWGGMPVAVDMPSQTVCEAARTQAQAMKDYHSSLCISRQ